MLAGRAVRRGVLRAADQRAGLPAHRGVAGPAADHRAERARPGHRPGRDRDAGGAAAGRRRAPTWSWWSRARTTGTWRSCARLGVPVVIADGTQPQTLASVSLASAAAVAILTSDDLANLETGLAVRDQLGARWPTTPVVLRMFDPQLARTVRVELRVRVRAVHGRAGRAVVRRRGARPGGAEHLLRRATSRCWWPGSRSPPTAGWPGWPWATWPPGPGCWPSAGPATTAHLEYPPRRGTRFRAGDRAYLIGPYEELLAVLRRDRPAPGASDQARPSGQPGA